MKAPPVSSDAGGVFHTALGNQNAPFQVSFPSGGFVMPVWLEVLLDVLAFAGFIGIAMFNRSAKKAAHKPSEKNGVS
jgi:hypothetical protein